MVATDTAAQKLSAEEMRTLHALLKRLTSRPLGPVIDIPSPTAEDTPIRLFPVPIPLLPLDPNDMSPAGVELRRRLAHPEEFIDCGETTILVE